MRYDPVFIVCDVRCPSSEEASRIQETLHRKCVPDSVMIDTVVGGGVTSEVSYRIGDFFSEILILPGLHGDPSAFRLVFHRHPQAGRFWKDIWVRIIRSVEEAGPNISVKLTYKGDEYLDWSQLTPA